VVNQSKRVTREYKSLVNEPKKTNGQPQILIGHLIRVDGHVFILTG
jgi:hypothetical protein